jgi:hypothetical protein
MGNIRVFKSYEDKKINKALTDEDNIKWYCDENIVVIAPCWLTYCEVYKAVRRYNIMPGAITQNILENIVG